MRPDIYYYWPPNNAFRKIDYHPLVRILYRDGIVTHIKSVSNLRPARSDILCSWICTTHINFSLLCSVRTVRFQDMFCEHKCTYALYNGINTLDAKQLRYSNVSGWRGYDHAQRTHYVRPFLCVSIRRLRMGICSPSNITIWIMDGCFVVVALDGSNENLRIFIENCMSISILENFKSFL